MSICIFFFFIVYCKYLINLQVKGKKAYLQYAFSQYFFSLKVTGPNRRSLSSLSITFHINRSFFGAPNRSSLQSLQILIYTGSPSFSVVTAATIQISANSVILFCQSLRFPLCLQAGVVRLLPALLFLQSCNELAAGILTELT